VTRENLKNTTQEILARVDVLEDDLKSETTRVKTLKELNLPFSCREVIDKDADSVLSEIETAVLSIAQSILAGDGFTYSLPSRSKTNQLYVPGTYELIFCTLWITASSCAHRDFFVQN